MALETLDLLKEGLPDTGAGTSRVVIIGAGMVGLVAGLLLKGAGHEVTILEGQNRLGGRILTYRGFAGDMYGEFGAMRFPLQHPMVRWLIQDKFKLDTQPFPMYDEDSFIYLQGKGVRRSEFRADMFGKLVYLVGGADAVPRAFEPEVMENIRLGAQAYGIEQNEKDVTVHFRAGRNVRTIVADECIVTVPLSSLRHMEIEGLDPAKWYAIRNTYYGRAHKLFMQFSERWWEDKYNITHGLSVTDLAIRNIVY